MPHDPAHDPRSDSQPGPRPHGGSTQDPLQAAVFEGRGSSGRITAFGAQVLAWQPAGALPVLYLSPRAVLDGSRAIRGGVPVCFPWFGAGLTGDRVPAHGLVRAVQWEQTDPQDADVAFATEAQGCSVRLQAKFSEALTLSISVVRTAKHPDLFELALHSYFTVSSAARVWVTGLAGADRLDQTTGERAVQGDPPVCFTGEFDRVYTGCSGPQTLHDPGLSRRIVVTPTNLPSAILWNPGPVKAAALSDLGADQHERFVCIESARVRADALVLQPGERFEATIRIEVLPLG